MRRDAASPDEYREQLEKGQREIVDRIREAIRGVDPEIEEGLAHGMLDYPGLANLGAQKRYVALYVAPVVLDRHRKAFPGVDSGKSCLRFRKLEQAPLDALRALLADVRSHRS